MTRRAIILVPGLAREERDQRRKVLIENLTLESARYPVVGEAPVAIDGLDGVSLTVRYHDGETHQDRSVDVFEAYWGDLLADQAAETPYSKALRGFRLLIYWFFSPVWLALWTNRMLTFGLLASGILLLLWYLSILIVAAEAVNAGSWATDNADALGPFAEIIGNVAAAIAKWPDWKYWFVVVGVLGAGSADLVASIASFARDYLTNQINATGTGLRSRIGHRVREVYMRVNAAGYDEVTVLGYSFGCAVGIDLLADYPERAALQRTRFVTWGAPVVPLWFRSAWMRDQVRTLREREDLARWDDVYSGFDWMGAPVPGHKAAAEARPETASPWRSEAAALSPQLSEILTGGTHQRYFHTQTVLEDLLAPQDPTSDGQGGPSVA